MFSHKHLHLLVIIVFTVIVRCPIPALKPVLPLLVAVAVMEGRDATEQGEAIYLGGKGITLIPSYLPKPFFFFFFLPLPPPPLPPRPLLLTLVIVSWQLRLEISIGIRFATVIVVAFECKSW